MKISRRDFLKFCTASSAMLALGPLELFRLEEALANPDGPTILWLQGAACTGCSVSFLNRISPSAPVSVADILINTVNLAYHPNLTSVAGESAVQLIDETYRAGNYILAVEGGVPTAYGGNTCWAWSFDGHDVTFLEAVRTLAGRAAKVLSIGTCASFGGIAAAKPNPTGVRGVGAATGASVINIAGCPPHPDWIAWSIAQMLAGSTIALDSNRRPRALFAQTVHDRCPRKGRGEAKSYGIDGRCLKELGCRGPETKAPCPTMGWNGGVNWCVDANANCIYCTEPGFPGEVLRKESQA